MNTRKLKHFIHYAVVLLVLGIVVGMAGCSKKAVKTASPDAIAADTEPATVEVASSGDGLTNAGSSGPVTEAFGRVTKSRGMLDDKGKIGELEIEIMDSGLDDASGSSSGRSVEIVADELEFGVEGSRGTASRAGEEFIVVQPGAAKGAQMSSGTGSLIAPGQLVPGGRDSGDERIFIESARARDTHAAGGTGRLSVEGETQGMAARGSKGGTMFLIEEAATGNIVNFSDAPESDAPGSAIGARASSLRKDETLLVIPRSKDEDPSSPERAESTVEPEYVPEPRIFAKAQPEIPSLLPARETESQAPSIASAATDKFVVEDIYFDFDRWAIPKPMQARLSEHAQWLNAHPGSAVLIEGHCDVRGSREYNMVLGEKRARSVKGFLLDLGVKEDQLSMISYGKERLTCFESREACHGDNRRAHFVLR